MHFHLLMVVWGEKYIRHMLDIGLLTVLAPGNAPALPGLDRSRLVFATTRQHEMEIRSHPTVQRLSELMALRFIHIEPSRATEPHALMSEAHRLAISEAVADQARVIVLSPDSIMSDGTLGRVGELAMAGKRAVLVTGLRLAEETAIPALKAMNFPHAMPNGVLRPRNLLRFAMQHFHPEVARYRFDSDQFTPHPLVCLWPVESSGFLQRAFHLHPLMLDVTQAAPRALESLATDTIDGSFAGRAFGNWDDIHIDQDSDSILMFSFSSIHDHIEAPVPSTASVSKLRKAAFRSNVNALHRYVFMKPIRLHVDDPDERWNRLEEETGLLAFDACDIGRVSPLVQGMIDEPDRSALSLNLSLNKVLLRDQLLKSGLGRLALRANRALRSPSKH